MTLAPEDLTEILEYSPETGVLVWRERGLKWFEGCRFPERYMAAWNTRRAGKAAFFYVDNHGYSVGNIMGRPYKAHRVAWAIHYGEWPKDQIDHINHNRLDNRIINLRQVDRQGNARNQKLRIDNPSGVAGVAWREDTKKWGARISAGGKTKYLGYFDRFEDAVAARRRAEDAFGYHPNHGRVLNAANSNCRGVHPLSSPRDTGEGPVPLGLSPTLSLDTHTPSRIAGDA